MLHFRIMGMALVVWLSILATGCSSLHTEVQPAFDWAEVASVILEEPPQDRWSLGPVVRQELQGMGFDILPATADRGDLVVRYFSTEAPDLDAESNLRVSLKSVHVQMVNPGDASLVAVSDYFLDSSDMPAQAVRKAFAGLRDKIPAATVSPQNIHPTRPVAESISPPGGTTQSPAPDKAEPEIKSLKRSPWLPELKSWGFEDWGEKRDTAQ